MRQTLVIFVILFLAVPGIASAHTGIEPTTGFLFGFTHPLGGVDHLLAMLATGIWAVQVGGRAIWTVPCVFVAVMTLAGALGILEIPVPYIEQGILLSIIVLGILIAGVFKLPLIYGSFIIGFFAIFHGYAHGTEMPASFNALSYATGFVFATIILHLLGIGIGKLIKTANLTTMDRLAGSTIFLSGIYLSIS